jgi:ADP-heptose:LPS heptosyltransferase
MKILIQRKASLGDVLNTTPVIHRFRREHPDAEIHYQTDHPMALFQNPHLSRWGYDQNGDYDLVCNLDGAFERNRSVHQVDAMLFTAFRDTDGDKSIIFTHEKEFKIPTVASAQLITIHAAKTWPSRTIPRDWWEMVTARLMYRNFVIAITGGVYDGGVYGDMDMVKDFRGKLTLAQQVALIESSAAFLVTGSGLMPLSGCTDTPVICPMTITHHSRAMPYRHGELGWNFTPLIANVPCYGCDVDVPECEYFACKFGHNNCVSSFDPDQTVEAVLNAIANDRRKELT